MVWLAGWLRRGEYAGFGDSRPWGVSDALESVKFCAGATAGGWKDSGPLNKSNKGRAGNREQGTGSRREREQTQRATWPDDYPGFAEFS